MQQDKELNRQELKNSEEIQEELDMQWQIYRLLNECEKRDHDLILNLKMKSEAAGLVISG